MGCVQDIFTILDAVVDENYSGNVSILNFGHSDTVQPVMAALGLYYDGRDLLVSYCYTWIIMLDNILIFWFCSYGLVRAGGDQTTYCNCMQHNSLVARIMTDFSWFSPSCFFLL